MNEPANFGTNEERPWNWPEDCRPYWSLKCPDGNFDDPPYRTSQCLCLCVADSLTHTHSQQLNSEAPRKQHFLVTCNSGARLWKILGQT